MSVDDRHADVITCPSCLGEAVGTDANATYACNGCDNTFQLYVSEHVRDKRWPERALSVDYESGTDVTDEFIINDVLQAWDDSRTLLEDYRDWTTADVKTVDADQQVGHRFVGDELRYHRATKTALLRKEHCIVTAVDVPSARDNLRYSIIQTLIADGDDTETIRDECARLKVTKTELSLITDREQLRRKRAGQGEATASGPAGPGQKPHSVASTEDEGGS